MPSLPSSPAFLKKRKFLILLPLPLVPFAVLLFYMLGGGKGKPDTQTLNRSGLNLKLPDAHFNQKKESDKLGLYEAASQDSVKWLEALKNDPYRTAGLNPLDSMSFSHSPEIRDMTDRTHSGAAGSGFDKFNPAAVRPGSEAREKEITDKLSRIKAMMGARPGDLPPDPEFAKTRTVPPTSSNPSALLSELNNNIARDPELSELDRMLDKIMTIQHPEISRDSAHHLVDNRKSVFRVETAEGGNVVMATIPEKQTLVSGATIRLQLSESVVIGGMTIPADQSVFGTVNLNQERLNIQVQSIRAGNHILPVSMEIYDLDGMEGIHVPGSIGRDVSKQSLDQSLSSLGLEALDPSIGAQAASAGIQAAKALISKKVKLVQVTIPEDYQVFLKNTH